MLLGLCGEVTVAVTPRVSESPGSLPLGGVCQRVNLDVALAPGVCVARVSDGSGGWELLLLLGHNSAAFRRHSHAVVSWNEARRGGNGKVRQVVPRTAMSRVQTYMNARTKTHIDGKVHMSR